MAGANQQPSWYRGDYVEGRRTWTVDLNSDAWSSRFVLAILAVVFGLLGGMLITAANPLYVAAGIVGLLVAVAILLNTQIGLFSLVGVVCLLPFAVIPVPLGSVKLTFLDATLSALLVVWIGRTLVRPEERLQVGRIGGFLLVFIFLAIVSFVWGTGYGVTPETARLFLKFINSFLLFFTIVNCVRVRKHLDQLVAALLLAGAGSAIIGLVLYFIPSATSARLLSSLRVLGYPASDVLRYIADTETLRATSTSIDPNVLGAMLMVVSVLGINQLLSPTPVVKRQWLLPAVGLTLACLLLTFSRSSWIGLIVALVFVATIKYRRLWIVLGLLAIVVVLGAVPGETTFVGHLQSGLMVQDRAAAMRLGEYKDAFRLISEYPWFGVGFGEAPSVDLYVGVSSIYLLIAEQMGLVGLGAFLLIIGYVLVAGLRQVLFQSAASPSPGLTTDAGLQAHQLGLLAALFAALTTGLLDHHFLNLRFPHTVALFWLIVGLIAVTLRLMQEPEES